MKTEQDKNYYNVEVFGDYFTSTAQGNVVKPYGPIFLKMRSWESAQRLARFNILPVLLQRADTEYKSIRLCKVLSIKTHDLKPVFGLPLKYMDRNQIELECKSQGFPLRSDMYPDIIELRQKLKFARENPDKFREREQKSIQAYAKVGDAIELNAHVFDNIIEQNMNDVDLGNKAPHESDRLNNVRIQPEPTLNDMHNEDGEFEL